MAITDVEDKVVHFRTFFNKNFPKVKTFAWQLLKSEEDAEDIAQDIKKSYLQFSKTSNCRT